MNAESNRAKMANPSISVIIPTYNEGVNLLELIDLLNQYGGNILKEILVVDGCSENPESKEILSVAEKKGANVLFSPEKGRSVQMNYGAARAKGNVFYFVHADVKIHKDFATDIPKTLASGYDMGCYRFVFDDDLWLLKINAWFTRFPFLWCSGGDQTLFVKKEIFNEMNGYRNDHQIMEDFEFIKRGKEGYKFKTVPKNIVLSARKYDNRSYWQVQWTNFNIMRMWHKGASQEAMVSRYKKMLAYKK